MNNFVWDNLDIYNKTLPSQNSFRAITFEPFFQTDLGPCLILWGRLLYFASFPHPHRDWAKYSFYYLCGLIENWRENIEASLVLSPNFNFSKIMSETLIILFYRHFVWIFQRETGDIRLVFGPRNRSISRSSLSTLSGEIYIATRRTILYQMNEMEIFLFYFGSARSIWIPQLLQYLNSWWIWFFSRTSKTFTQLCVNSTDIRIPRRSPSEHHCQKSKMNL